MASYDIGAVRTALNALIDTATSVKSVYSYPNPKIEGYPSAIFELDNEDGTMLDDANNQRILTFKIWLACEVSVNGLENASVLLDGVTKEVVNLLENKANQSLSGACDWMMPVIGARQQVNSPEGAYLYQELQLKVYIASSIL